MSKRPNDDRPVIPGMKIATWLEPGRARDLVNYENGLRALIAQLDAEPDIPAGDYSPSWLRDQGLGREINEDLDGEDA